MEEDKSRHRRKRLIVLSIVLLLAVMTATELLIRQVGEPIDVKENLKLFLLLNVNIIISLGLVATVFRQLVKLYLERKQKVLGSKFKSKLILAFVGLTLIPTVLLFLVSNNLVNSTVDNWFNAQNEEALKKALDIAQTHYQSALGETIDNAQGTANLIGEKNLMDFASYPQLKKMLGKLQKEADIGSIKIYNPGGVEIYSLPAEKDYPRDFPSSEGQLIRKGLIGEKTSSVSGSFGEEDIIDASVPIMSPGDEVIGVMLFNFHAPKDSLGRINDIRKSYEDYKTRKIFKLPLKSIYSLIVLVTTLMVILAAVWLSFHIAKGITVSFQKLAEGTREVATGNLEYRVEDNADEEINILVQSFNRMTADLRQNKAEIEKITQNMRKTNEELARGKNYTETVLENITSGVISLDNQDRISTVNQAASRTLKLPDHIIGSPYTEALSEKSLAVLRDFISDVKRKGRLKRRAELQLQMQGEILTVLASATILRSREGAYQGQVLVFDDITQLIKAQKTAAWQEVARRIAHEIKNPLTPIQLSTQRLRKKFAQGAPDYEQVFDECTNTIISEVETIKRMVNEFSRFARLPSTQLQPQALNQVIGQTLSLYSSIPEGIQILTDLDENIPSLMLDAGQIKQMLVNLIDNALHAMGEGKFIWIKTAYYMELKTVRIEVADEGEGIAPEDKEKMFLPYFSTKKEGTGLGLAIVSRIVTEHNGEIRVEDNSPRGSRFIIELPLSA